MFILCSMSQFPLAISDHILFAIIGIILPVISVYSSSGNTEGLHLTKNEKCRAYAANSLILFFLASLVFLNWNFLDRPIGDLGFKIPAYSDGSLWIILLILFIVLYLADTISSIYPASRRKKTLARLQKRAYILPVTRQEFYCFIILSLSAGIFEEIMFRGFLITYLYNLFGSSETGVYAAVVIPAVLFGISHAYQGGYAVIKVVLMAVLFGLVFLFSGSIIWLMIIHFLVDIIGGVLALHLFSEQGFEENEIL